MDDPVVLSREEALTRQFWDWEIRGRGWWLWQEPIDLEPPFRPFFGHYLESSSKGISDDGRRPTFFGGITERIAATLRSRPQPPDCCAFPEIEEPAATLFDNSDDLVEISLAVPPDLKITGDLAESF